DGNVGAPLAQRRERNGDDVEAEIEILAEGSFFVFGFEVAVGGGHDADVHSNLLIAAHGADFFLLEKAQELGLHFERKFADLVEKNGSGIGRLQQARLGTKSAGESTFFVAEQFAFDEGGDERSAIDGNKGEVGHASVKVKGASHQFFAGSALAGNQDWGAGVFEAGDAAQEKAQFIERSKGLGNVIVGAELHGLDGGFDGAVAGHDGDLDAGVGA